MGHARALELADSAFKFLLSGFSETAFVKEPRVLREKFPLSECFPTIGRRTGELLHTTSKYREVIHNVKAKT